MFLSLLYLCFLYKSDTISHKARLALVSENAACWVVVGAEEAKQALTVDAPCVCLTARSRNVCAFPWAALFHLDNHDALKKVAFTSVLPSSNLL